MQLETRDIEDSQEHVLITIRVFCVQLTLVINLILISIRRSKDLI